MNLRRALMPVKDNSGGYETGARLGGRWLVFIATIPAFNNDLHNGCAAAACHTLIPPYTAKQYQAAGFSIQFALIFTYTFTLLFSLIFLTIGIFIFWLRSDDFMALFSSFALVTFPMSFNNSMVLGLVPAWSLPVEIITFLGSVLFGVFFYLFPTGHFIPQWTRWLIVGWIVYSIADYFFPNSPLANSLIRPYGPVFDWLFVRDQFGHAYFV